MSTRIPLQSITPAPAGWYIVHKDGETEALAAIGLDLDGQVVALDGLGVAEGDYNISPPPSFITGERLVPGRGGYWDRWGTVHIRPGSIDAVNEHPGRTASEEDGEPATPARIVFLVHGEWVTVEDDEYVRAGLAACGWLITPRARPAGGPGGRV